MAKIVYPTRTEAQAEATRLNAARVRDNFEYGAGENRVLIDGKFVCDGYYVACYSND